MIILQQLKFLRFFVFFAFILSTKYLIAQDSFLDPSFGEEGKVEFSFTDKNEFASLLTVQSDGKAIAAGSFITRYNLDGTIDTTFGENGYINTIHTTYYDDYWNLTTGNVNFYATAIDIQSDDSFIIAFNTISQHDYSFHIRKYSSNGVLDNSFEYSSEISIYETTRRDVLTLKCLPNNKVLIGGGRFFGENDGPTTLLMQLNADGSIDENFNTDIYYTGGVVRDIKIQDDGKFVIVGAYRFFTLPLYVLKYGIYCGRLNPDGSTDTLFGNLGFRTIVPPNADSRLSANIYLTSGNKIYLSGYIRITVSEENSFWIPFICKLNNNGTEDSTFGNNGYVIKSDTPNVARCKVFVDADHVFLAYSRAIYNNNNVFQIQSFQIDKYDTNGQFQSIHLKNQSRKINSFYDYAKSPNGDFYFIMRAYSFPVVALLKTNSNLGNNLSFGNNGYANLSFEGGNAHSITPHHSLLQNDGKFLVGGQGQYLSVCRFNADGTKDVDFNSNFKYNEINSTTNKLAIQSDQKILVGYYSSFNNNTGKIIISRINPTGTIDNTFATNGELEIPLYSISSDNKFEILVDTNDNFFVIGNNFQSTSVPTMQIKIHKFNANGQIDNSFGNNGVVSNSTLTHTSALLSNNNIFVGGFKDNDFAITKILPSGAVDTTFGTNGLVTTDFSIRNDKINKLMLTPTNKIMALGVSSGIIGLAKYNLNGSFDTSFGIQGRTLVEHPPIVDAIVNQDETIIFINKENLDFQLKKISAVGELETNFGDNGSIYTDFYSGNDTPVNLFVQPDNKLVAIGYNSKLILSRYNANANVLFIETTTDFASKINYYPNPFVDRLTVEFDNNTSEDIINFRLIDYTGKSIFTTQKYAEIGKNKIDVNMPSSLSKGYYILNITIGNQEKNIKLIK